jgi:hypothetical protein
MCIFRSRTHYCEGQPLLPRLSYIVRRFIRNASLPRGEATRVKKEQGPLEKDVIKEMLLSSPHPVVSSIAAQALAALCLDEPSTLNTVLDPAVWMRIDQIFTQSFLKIGITTDKEYEPLEPTSTIERLARALLYSPFCSSTAVSDRLDAFVNREPTDIRLAAIQAFKLRAHTFINSWGCVPKRLALIQNFLKIEDIEICRVHPWQRRQLSYAAAIPFGDCSYRDGHTFFPELLKNLDLDKPPLLQQEMLIFLLNPEMIDYVQSYGRLPRAGAVCSLRLRADNWCLRPFSHYTIHPSSSFERYRNWPDMRILTVPIVLHQTPFSVFSYECSGVAG